MVESTIARLDAEYKQGETEIVAQKKSNVAQKKSTTDEIQMALNLIQENEAAEKERINEMNEYIRLRKEECEKITLLDS